MSKEIRFEKIGNAIKSLREAKNITQSELADKTGLKPEYLSRIESSKLPNPTVKTVNKILNVLGNELTINKKQKEK